jgi:hypothetical protein
MRRDHEFSYDDDVTKTRDVDERLALTDHHPLHQVR